MSEQLYFLGGAGLWRKRSPLEPLSQCASPIKVPQLWPRMCANTSGCFTPATAGESLKRRSRDLIIQGLKCQTVELWWRLAESLAEADDGQMLVKRKQT